MGAKKGLLTIIKRSADVNLGENMKKVEREKRENSKDG
jgi:hypothetical protein